MKTETDFERMLKQPSDVLARLANTTGRNPEETRLIEMAQAIRAMGDNAPAKHPTLPDPPCETIFEFILHKEPTEIERLFNAAIKRVNECSISMMIVAMGES